MIEEVYVSMPWAYEYLVWELVILYVPAKWPAGSHPGKNKTQQGNPPVGKYASGEISGHFVHPRSFFDISHKSFYIASRWKIA